MNLSVIEFVLIGVGKWVPSGHWNYRVFKKSRPIFDASYLKKIFVM